MVNDYLSRVQVPGSPGPVYLSYMQAMRKFLNICLFLVFIFLVVLSFGESHKVSPGNQMLAAMAGGFMPMFFRTIMRQGGSGVETDLVSFRGKLQEVVKGFFDLWPMYDLIFEIGEKPVENHDKDGEGGGGGVQGDAGKGGGDDGKGGGGGPTNHPGGKAPTDGEKEKGKASGPGGAGLGGGRRPADGGKQRRAQEVAQRLATLKDQVDSMQLMPARDKHVDILILTENSDIEWVMEESFSDYSPAIGASMSSFSDHDLISRERALTNDIAMVTELPSVVRTAVAGGEPVTKDATEDTPLVANDAVKGASATAESAVSESSTSPAAAANKDAAAPVIVEMNPPHPALLTPTQLPPKNDKR